VKVFPALAALKKVDSEKISLVNGGIVEEVLLPIGELDFGSGPDGKLRHQFMADTWRA
jgi:hypothetical protein